MATVVADSIAKALTVASASSAGKSSASSSRPTNENSPRPAHLHQDNSVQPAAPVIKKSPQSPPPTYTAPAFTSQPPTSSLFQPRSSSATHPHISSLFHPQSSTHPNISSLFKPPIHSSSPPNPSPTTLPQTTVSATHVSSVLHNSPNPQLPSLVLAPHKPPNGPTYTHCNQSGTHGYTPGTTPVNQVPYALKLTGTPTPAPKTAFTPFNPASKGVTLTPVSHNIPRDNVPRDNVPRDNIPRDNMSRDNMSRDNIPRGNMSHSIRCDNSNTPRGNMSYNGNRGNMSYNVTRDIGNLTRDNMSHAGTRPGVGRPNQRVYQRTGYHPYHATPKIIKQEISSSGGHAGSIRTSGAVSGGRPHVAILRPLKGKNGQTLHIGKSSTSGSSRGFPIQLQSSGQTTYIQLDNATYRALTGKQSGDPARQPPAAPVRPNNSTGTSSGGQYVRLEYDVNTGHPTSPQYALDTPSDTFHSSISNHHNQYYDSYGNSYYDRSGSQHNYHKLDFPDINSQRNSQAAIRAAPVTITWLMANYEVADGVSLPRCLMYSHYKQHCREHKLEPVNAASFGKIIRSIFVNLKTRRLGTRGNSKYHYYGIRIKNDSILNSYGEDYVHSNRTKHISRISIQTAPDSGPTNENYENHIKYIGAPPLSFVKFTKLAVPEGTQLPESITDADVQLFASSYLNHCVGIVYAVGLLNFPEVEGLWQSFWQGVGLTSNSYKRKLCLDFTKRDGNEGHGEGAADVPASEERHVPKEVLRAMCEMEWVHEWVRAIDYSVYQMLIDIVMPDVLHPIPGSLTQMIRNFAKNMETVMLHALSGLPVKFLQVKCITANAFAQTLRRYTSLNHLAQAARAVLQNSHQISQMLADLNRVDFTNVQEQASWVCGCSDSAVAELEKSFKGALEQQQGLEGWAAWLKSVVDKRLAPFNDKPEFPQHAKYFLLNWSFYCSMVIRDLTLRSAASFGSFHLIRLLYDEYMYYLVEQRVAKFRNTDPVVVMGECITLHQSMIKKCEEASKQVFSEQNQPMEPGALGTGSAGSSGGMYDDNEDEDSYESDDDDSHQLTSLDTGISGKAIPYLSKDNKTYSKAIRPSDQVTVKIEPRENSNGAFSFDENEEEHSSKRQCVG